jgi:hypothetical protein
MLTILWDPTEFAVAIGLESGRKFNTGYYVSKLLTQFSEWWCKPGGGDFRKLIVPADNARPHNATLSQHFIARNEIVIAALLTSAYSVM